MVHIINHRIFWLLLAILIGLVKSSSPASETLTLDELKKTGILNSVLRTQIPSDVKAENLSPELDLFHNSIQSILEAHCVSCHGPKKAKARFRVDTLDPNLFEGEDVDWWVEVQAVLTNGEMPPPEDSELIDKDRVKVIDWLSGEIRKASLARRAGAGHTSFRRMTRYEYNYALQDILGFARNFARDLPPEAHSEDGFQNSSEVLKMSVTQLETYRNIARNALLRATVMGEKPPVLYWSVPMARRSQRDWDKQEAQFEKARNELQAKPLELKKEIARLDAQFKKPGGGIYFMDLKTGRKVPHSWNYHRAEYALKPTLSQPIEPGPLDKVAVISSGRHSKLIIEMGDQLPDQGILRVRVRASAVNVEANRNPSMQLEFGWQASNEGRALLLVSDNDYSISSEPKFYQWDVPLGDIYPRNTVRGTSALGSMPSPSEHIRIVNSSASKGDIQIDYVEIATPVYDVWPPESHNRIFIESPNSENEERYAQEILNTFMPRAWRRPVSDNEINKKLKLFKIIRGTCDTFEEAVIEVLATILSSPNFIYVTTEAEEENPGKNSNNLFLSDYEIASRLAIFLWCSIPDDELLRLASEGQLRDKNILVKEVKRMLDDPRAERFSQHFVHQWLDMQLLDFLKPGKGLSPTQKQAMLQEPVQFFREILSNNESVLNFIHADYSMLNERLASYYGIGGVFGNHFRRVKLTQGFKRGGLMTQAGLLAMNASGEDSNPLKRGIWMLESLLNDPPPPPPPAVPEIDLADPEIAKMTLKERIADHRNHAACMSCHKKIDPWGIAFENYDAFGRWRDKINGNPVDATSTLFNDDILNGMDGLKRFLLSNRQDQFVMALTHKLSSYGLGRPLTFADSAGVEKIAAQVRLDGDGLETLILKFATSNLFLSK